MARARVYRTTTIEGVEELQDMFERMDVKADKILESASEQAAKIVLSDAKNRAPVSTGALRNSIAIRKEKRKNKKHAYQVYCKGEREGGVSYSMSIEIGTSDTPARPFLRPALDANKNAIINKVSDVIATALEG